MTDEVAIPAGMKPWAGGDAAPTDWDGGPVLWIERAGHKRVGPKQPEQPWTHGAKNWFDIIAYTPMTPEPAQPAESPEARARKVLDDETLGPAMCRNEYSEVDGEPYVTVDQAIRAMLTFAASTARPTERGAVEAIASTLAEYHRIMTTPFDPTKMTGVGYDRTMMENARKLVAGLPSVIKALRALATQPATGRTMGGEDDLMWLSGQHRLSLVYYSPMYGDDDDQSEEWRVSKESGSINDREWDIVGRGQTAAEAISTARAALQNGGK